MGAFRLLLSGDSLQWCQSMTAVFGENPIFDVVGNVMKGSELVIEAIRLRPDVILWKLTDEDPVPVVTELCMKCPGVQLILLLDLDSPSKTNFPELFHLGVSSCLPSRLFPRQIIQAVELTVVAGMLCIPRPGPNFLIFEFKTNCLSNGQSLSSREREILTLLGKNNSNQEIAQALFLSESTVKTHLRNLFRKLNVRNRMEALLVAIQGGLLDQNNFRTEEKN